MLNKNTERKMTSLQKYNGGGGQIDLHALVHSLPKEKRQELHNLIVREDIYDIQKNIAEMQEKQAKKEKEQEQKRLQDKKEMEEKIEQLTDKEKFRSQVKFGRKYYKLSELGYFICTPGPSSERTKKLLKWIGV